MSVFYLGFITLYSFLLLIMKRKWKKEKRFSTSLSENELKIAVLIPYRNELTHLPRLLRNVLAVSLPSTEVILVDDHSDDGSQVVVGEFIAAHNLKLWKMKCNIGNGKKAALTTAINSTVADVIFTTDADCILSHKWLHGIGEHFVKDSVQMVAGPVMTESGEGFFSHFQQIEWASVLLVTRAAFSLDRPLTVSGANLAYRRSAFYAVRGFDGNERHLSGDDEFLLKKIVQKYGAEALIFTQQTDVVVKTFAFDRVRDFINQRIRWASKWNLHRSIYHTGAALINLLVAVVHLSSFGLLLGNTPGILVFFVYWTVKVMVEKNILGEVLSEYGVDPPGWAYLKTSYIHPVYSVWIGIFSIRGKFIWKGRKNDFHL